jgi:hypothetical protein
MRVIDNDQNNELDFEELKGMITAAPRTRQAASRGTPSSCIRMGSKQMQALFTKDEGKIRAEERVGSEGGALVLATSVGLI